MIKVSLKEAEGHLGELIEEAAAGQGVVITRDAGPAVRLILVPPSHQEEVGSSKPIDADLISAAPHFGHIEALQWVSFPAA